MNRVQYKRGDKLPPNTKLVTRRTRWGNPYKVIPWGPYVLEESLSLYRKDLIAILKNQLGFLEPLRGFDLACACPLYQDCHADIIMELLENE